MVGRAGELRRWGGGVDDDGGGRPGGAAAAVAADREVAQGVVADVAGGGCVLEAAGFWQTGAHRAMVGAVAGEAVEEVGERSGAAAGVVRRCIRGQVRGLRAVLARVE